MIISQIFSFQFNFVVLFILTSSVQIYKSKILDWVGSVLPQNKYSSTQKKLIHFCLEQCWVFTTNRGMKLYDEASTTWIVLMQHNPGLQYSHCSPLLFSAMTPLHCHICGLVHFLHLCLSFANLENQSTSNFACVLLNTQGIAVGYPVGSQLAGLKIKYIIKIVKSTNL